MDENQIPSPNCADDTLLAELRTDALIGTPSHRAYASGAETGRVQHEGSRNRPGVWKCDADPEIGDVVDQASDRRVFVNSDRSDLVSSHTFGRSALDHCFGSGEDDRTAVSHPPVKDARSKCIKFDANADRCSSPVCVEPSPNRPSESIRR